MHDMTESLPRAIPLEGASNLRDLGGWPTADGGRVRPGLVFRSAALAGLTGADQAWLARAGLRTVCDLRGREEAAAAPSRLDAVPDVAVHPLPIEPSVGASLRDILATREATGADLMALLRQAYVAYALDWSHRYRAMFALLLEETRRPLLFHCSAGKDRTGFGAALLLTALGVPRGMVFEDYLATNRIWRGDSKLAAGLPEPLAGVLLRVHPELLQAALDAASARHGSIEAYLEEAIGLDAPARAELRGRLVARRTAAS